MGLRYRKSINFKSGFRINFSKSGIGYSWGFPGYRITRRVTGSVMETYTLPGTGISYVKEHGSKKNKQSQPSKLIRARQTSHMESQRKSTQEINLANYKEIGFDISSSIENSIRISEFSISLIFIATIVSFPLFFAMGLFSILLPITAVTFCILVHKFTFVELEYNLDDEKKMKYHNRLKAWDMLRQSEFIWQIIDESYDDSYKYTAGAKTLVSRVPCHIEKVLPFYLKSNVDIMSLRLSNVTLVFMPDLVFVIFGRNVGCLLYEDIDIYDATISFVEHEITPRDAKVIKKTWMFLNKDGTPDKRFNNNKHLDVCEYGVVHITSPKGLRIQLQVSSESITRNFIDIIRYN